MTNNRGRGFWHIAMLALRHLMARVPRSKCWRPKKRSAHLAPPQNPLTEFPFHNKNLKCLVALHCFHEWVSKSPEEIDVLSLSPPPDVQPFTSRSGVRWRWCWRTWRRQGKPLRNWSRESPLTRTKGSAKSLLIWQRGCKVCWLVLWSWRLEWDLSISIYYIFLPFSPYILSLSLSQSLLSDISPSFSLNYIYIHIIFPFSLPLFSLSLSLTLTLKFLPQLYIYLSLYFSSSSSPLLSSLSVFSLSLVSVPLSLYICPSLSLYIYIHIHIHAVELLSGPRLGVFNSY